LHKTEASISRAVAEDDTQSAIFDIYTLRKKLIIISFFQAKKGIYMKAIGFYQYLPVEDPESLVEVEVPTPEPRGRDLLVRVKAVSVNPVDTKVRARQELLEKEPRIPGWDAAGVVEASNDWSFSVN
jgi:hypothetical protein